MSKLKCTQGEWSFHPYGNPTPRECNDGEWFYASYCIGSGDKMIADVRFSTLHGGFPQVASIEEFTANANLIRCAPRLYEALEGLLHGGDREEAIAALRDARGEDQPK